MKNYITILEKQYSDTLNEFPKVRRVLECTASKLNISTDEFRRGLLYYDGSIGEFANEVYEDFGIRGALYLKYFINGSYQVERQKILSEFVGITVNNGAKSFVDIGYGAPGLYIQDLILKDKTLKLTLLDKFENSKIFAKEMLDCINSDNHVTFGEYDFDRDLSLKPFDCYILFDSIEHAANPNESFKQLVDGSGQDAQFILSMPIMPMEKITGTEHGDMHFIEWLTEGEAIDWLQSFNLKIKNQKSVFPNPEVDQWSLGLDFHNVVVRCSKK